MNSTERLSMEASVIPYMPLMKRERTAALAAYTERRGPEIALAQELVGSIANNPDLLLDSGLRETGLEAAMTVYTMEMYRLSVHPGTIFEKKEQIRSETGKTRKGTLCFINNMNQISKRQVSEQGSCLPKEGVALDASPAVIMEERVPYSLAAVR